jgi:hypothetical protein
MSNLITSTRPSFARPPTAPILRQNLDVDADDDEELVLDAEDLILEEEEVGESRSAESGKIGWALAWLLGVPLPLLLVIYLVTRAC